MSPVLHCHRSSLSELAPSAPSDCFGRDEFIEEVVDLACDFTPIALVGPKGIGKTYIARTVLHHPHVIKKFGEDRRFIHYDPSLASPACFLAKFSRVIGAGVDNPQDLGPLRHFLYSRKILIVIDQVESILDSEGKDSEEIYSMLDELADFTNLSICLTSRVRKAPDDYSYLEIPTLSEEGASNLPGL